MAERKSQKEEFGKRIESEAKGAQQITNDDLACRDCIYATVETVTCEMYLNQKPGRVLYGGECEDFESE